MIIRKPRRIKQKKIPDMFRVGDKVAVLDEDMEGEVVSVNTPEIEIETSEGFVLVFDQKDLVKLESRIKNILPEDVDDFSQVLKQKESSMKKRSSRPRSRNKAVPPMEVDLHISKLVAKPGRMNNFEILNLQLQTAQRQLEFAMSKRIQKVVFIHGVGEGVLRAELETLFSRYDNLKFYDADYQKYGLGATEVYIFQNY